MTEPICLLVIETTGNKQNIAIFQVTHIVENIVILALSGLNDD